MNVIMSTNEKGGVGKTSVMVNLATCLAMSGRRVLLVDLDRQGSVGGWLVGPDGSKVGSVARRAGLTVSSLLSDPSRLGEFALPTSAPGLDVVCSDRDFVQATNEGIAGMVEACSGAYDYLLFDLRRDAAESIEDVSALAFPMKAIVPVVSDGEELTGVRKVMSDIGSRCDFRILSNNVEKRTIRDRVAFASRRRDVPGAPFFEASIRHSALVGEATYAGVGVVSRAPRSRVAQDFRDLGEEVVAWCEKGAGNE